MIQIISFLAVLALASAAPGALTYAQQPIAYAQQPIAYAQPLHVKTAVAVQPEPFDPNPQYNYGYSIQDGLTGDSKSHQESRSGDVVQGQYSLVEPDGSIRTVSYTADDVNGFNAVVDRQAPQVHVKTVAAVAKVHSAPIYAHAQPALAYNAQPALAYAHGPAYGGIAKVHAAPAYHF